MRGMSPEMAARQRMDVPVLLIGIIVWIIGIGALLIHVLRGTRAGRLLLWFSTFSIVVLANVLIIESCLLSFDCRSGTCSQP